MTNTNLFFKRMVPVGLALGTAWAARGQIGHEYGAAWAGSIGVLTVLALAARKDWYNRLPVVAALGAIGWGTGGIISYGKVVGFGHTGDLLNTGYGLMMLLIIGGLYGFLGGGITGLALESSPAKKVDWANLLTQLFTGGFLSWGFFIFEMEWFMTPPRSELWAACLGAAIALAWYLYRNGYHHALRTASFSAAGAGFGFAIGNFLQRMGQTTGIEFNWWNVMEYSIGFFGGLGMAYGIFSGSGWPETEKPDRLSNSIAWVFLIVLLPVVNLVEAITTKTMTATGEVLKAPDPAMFAITWQTVMWSMSILFMVLFTVYFKPFRTASGTQQRSVMLTIGFLTWFVLISNFISGTWLIAKFSSQHLYWVNLLAIGLFLWQRTGDTNSRETSEEKAYAGRLLKCCVAIIVVVFLAAVVAVQFGHVNPKVESRF